MIKIIKNHCKKLEVQQLINREGVIKMIFKFSRSKNLILQPL